MAMNKLYGFCPTPWHDESRTQSGALPAPRQDSIRRTCSRGNVIHVHTNREGESYMQHTTQRPATASGTFPIGGDPTVYRLGFGTMRLTGPGIWGPPTDKQEALAVLRHALDLGVNLLDTADSYGPEVAASLIAEALYPYPKDLVIATRGGLLRTGPNQWPP